MDSRQRHLLCYLGSGNGLTVLSEHVSRVDALETIRNRDFSNSSLEGASFYILEANKVTPTARWPQETAHD